MSNKLHPIIWQASKKRLTATDIQRILGITPNTFKSYLKRPMLMRLEQITTLAGLFGMRPEDLLYLLIRNKPQLKKEDVWYLDEMRARHKDEE